MKQTHDPETIRAAVRQHYSEIATAGVAPTEATSCCSTSKTAAAAGCCGADAQARTLGYTDAELANVPEGANLGLGCGNPVAIASLKAGQTVLDLGAGAGFDAFLAARAVGPTGR